MSPDCVDLVIPMASSLRLLLSSEGPMVEPVKLHVLLRMFWRGSRSFYLMISCLDFTQKLLDHHDDSLLICRDWCSMKNGC